jgi:hypothetical protein
MISFSKKPGEIPEKSPVLVLSPEPEGHLKEPVQDENLDVTVGLDRVTSNRSAYTPHLMQVGFV